MFLQESVWFGGKELRFEIGKMAKQADMAVVLRYGDSVVLTTVVASNVAKEGIDFTPLSVEYMERIYAGGRIPGGYFKREGRPTEGEVLTSRLIDRPCRPLFQKGWKFETQVISMALSIDKENATDVLAMTGASCALHGSSIPWDGPFVGVRVGRIAGSFVVNPTFAQRELSDLDLVVAVTKDAIVMVEGGADEISETDLVNALMFAHESAKPVLETIEKIRTQLGKVKRVFVTPELDEKVWKDVCSLAQARLADTVKIKDKKQRREGEEQIRTEVVAALCTAENALYPERQSEVVACLSKLLKKVVRTMILDEQIRIDGRKTDEIRAISSEVGVLPRVHGSSLFTRGETQALVTVTLGTSSDEQRIDSVLGDVTKRFMLHYNFPPFSTGEAKPLRGQSRREVGHGNLAERALLRMMPKASGGFPYVVRVVSEILESNGSSSMASVCGGSLALMDAGIPIKSAVSGIAMGLIYEKTDAGEKIAVLSDILGDEDHLGDMDFKVCGTQKGVTAVQMDIKIKGLSREILEKALVQAKQGREHILSKMNETLLSTKAEFSPYAPRIYTIQVKPDRIRDIIGPGGKMIRAIVEQTGVSIDVSDDGAVQIASSDQKAANKAIEIIKGLTASAEVGVVYKGIVRRIVDFGAFVEILPGTDGLIHISELSNERVAQVSDLLKEGDEIMVKVISIDKMGKIRLSRKELTA